MNDFAFPELDGKAEEKPSLPAIPPMNAARALLDPFRYQSGRLLALADKLQVTDEASSIEATNLAGQVKKALAAVETARKNYTKPFNDHVKRVNGLAKEVSAPLDMADTTIRTKLTRFIREQEIKRREKERRAREAAAAEQARLDAEAKAAGVEAPIVPEVVQPTEKDAGKIRAEGGTVSTVKKWSFALTDITKVPREYMCVDLVKVRQAINAGVREIPGINIFEEESIRIR